LEDAVNAAKALTEEIRRLEELVSPRERHSDRERQT
jgi:hypothetical protein